MDEDEPHAHDNGALIAKEKDPEANHSATGKQQRWGLLTNICKVDTINCLYSAVSASTVILVAVLELQRRSLPQLPMDQALIRAA